MMRLLTYSDGSHSVVEIAERYDASVETLAGPLDRLREVGLLEPAAYTPDHSDRFDLPAEER
ncbi:winged helix-turn-helix domain-containing protein [Halorussus sp. MSC15.2]|uniref:winged helix-turn-helix domain-containing protein n=1 Tax=Halorussus sp. MSC15.2 TaxID=2283638 RepID=UPI0035C8B4E1